MQISTSTPLSATHTHSAAEPFAEQQKVVRQLKSRDQEVRAHEQAHRSAAGALAQGTQYSYQRGPDGQRYAVGGEVSIDTGKVAGDPQATINKARTIIAAALAPAQPSAQDRMVAAQAQQMLLKAQAELSRQDKRLQAYQQAGAPDDSGTAKGLHLQA
ncbi:putative metalloprotease CJM1_0395 family protein [Gallaecimonas sp. GXIMD1310]|uniref:putative metalloprotease CJM1_0395 family protein n=1 Tax=Gallaecimonas sp. GXIMD1310 TaxID=3131926 RepID=UPI0032437BF6